MLQLILGPRKGWEDIEMDAVAARQLLTKGFIPFIALASATVLIRFFYVDEMSVAVMIQQAIICFLKYFASYYLGCFVFTLYLPTCIDGSLSMGKVNTFLLYGFGLLALINIIQNCIPVELAISFIMPVYALYILWRGIRYLSISFEGIGTFLLLVIFALIVPPYLIQYLFNMIIPAH
ncbi:MAG: hypothetical protein NC230_06305 [Bacteroides sp.]|nr:hypothetical protein [Bacteroides sp.]